MAEIKPDATYRHENIDTDSRRIRELERQIAEQAAYDARCAAREAAREAAIAAHPDIKLPGVLWPYFGSKTISYRALLALRHILTCTPSDIPTD